MWGFRTFSSLAVPVLTTACAFSPSESRSVTGTWHALGTGHSTYYELTLTQSGDAIAGVACGSSGGILLFEAPVTGRFPRLTFVTPGTGQVFAGAFEEDRDQIAGNYGRSEGPLIPLRFTRWPSGRCGATAGTASTDQR